MEKLYKIGKSNIEGEGLIAIKNLNPGDLVGLSHVDNIATPDVGAFHNHSDEANTVNVEVDNLRYLVVEQPIKKGDEITVNYRLQPELEQPEDFEIQKANEGGDSMFSDDNMYPISGEIGFVNGNSNVVRPTRSTTYANNILGQQTYFQKTGEELPKAQLGGLAKYFKRNVVDEGGDLFLQLKQLKNTHPKRMKELKLNSSRKIKKLIDTNPEKAQKLITSADLSSDVNFLTNVQRRVSLDANSGLNYYKDRTIGGLLNNVDNVNIQSSLAKMGDDGVTSVYRYGEGPLNSGWNPDKGWYSADPMEPFRYEEFRRLGDKGNIFKIDVPNEHLSPNYRGGPQQGTGFNSLTKFKEFEMPEEIIKYSGNNLQNLGSISDYAKYLETLKKYGGSLPKAQDGLSEFCTNGPIINSGGKVFAQCRNRDYDSEHNFELGAAMSMGKLDDEFTTSFRGTGGYEFNPSGGTGGFKGYLGANYGGRATTIGGVDGNNMKINPVASGILSAGYTGEVGGNSYNWQNPTQYELGAYADKDLIGNDGTTFGGYGRYGILNAKAGYNANTGPQFSIGLGLPLRQGGGKIAKAVKDAYKRTVDDVIYPIKRKYDAYKYNNSVDLFGNTGRSFGNDVQQPLARGSSIIQFKGLGNSNPIEEGSELAKLFEEYTVDSSPFKYGTQLGVDNAMTPLSVLKDANGRVINAVDDRYATMLRNYILNNKLIRSSGSNNPLTLARKFNEHRSITGVHGNIADLTNKFNSGETFKLGDNTSWSVGTENLRNFGEHRYIIKDFDFNTPALLNEYKNLTKSQKNVMLNEREVLLADPNFKVTNLIKNAPRYPGLRIDTKQAALNNANLNKEFGNVPQMYFNIDKNKLKGSLEYNFDVSKPLKYDGKTNSKYKEYLWLKENDPSFKETVIPSYGTDIELELVKRKGGSIMKNKKYTQSPFNENKLTVIDPTSMVKEIAEAKGFTSEFKNGGTIKLINGYNASKEYDKERKLPFFAYGGEPNIEGRLYYDQDSQDDLYNFNMIDIADELIKKQNKHNRTKMIIEKYENNLTLSSTESEHLNSLGLLD